MNQEERRFTTSATPPQSLSNSPRGDVRNVSSRQTKILQKRQSKQRLTNQSKIQNDTDDKTNKQLASTLLTIKLDDKKYDDTIDIKGTEDDFDKLQRPKSYYNEQNNNYYDYSSNTPTLQSVGAGTLNNRRIKNDILISYDNRYNNIDNSDDEYDTEETTISKLDRDCININDYDTFQNLVPTIEPTPSIEDPPLLNLPPSSIQMVDSPEPSITTQDNNGYNDDTVATISRYVYDDTKRGLRNEKSHSLKDEPVDISPSRVYYEDCNTIKNNSILCDTINTTSRNNIYNSDDEYDESLYDETSILKTGKSPTIQSIMSNTSFLEQMDDDKKSLQRNDDILSAIGGGYGGGDNSVLTSSRHTSSITTDSLQYIDNPSPSDKVVTSSTKQYPIRRHPQPVFRPYTTTKASYIGVERDFGNRPTSRLASSRTQVVANCFDSKDCISTKTTRCNCNNYGKSSNNLLYSDEDEDTEFDTSTMLEEY